MYTLYVTENPELEKREFRMLYGHRQRSNDKLNAIRSRKIALPAVLLDTAPNRTAFIREIIPRASDEQLREGGFFCFANMHVAEGQKRGCEPREGGINFGRNMVKLKEGWLFATTKQKETSRKEDVGEGLFGSLYRAARYPVYSR